MGLGEAFRIFLHVKGTRIRTETGDTPIEALEIDDMIPTLDHGLHPIHWIGYRTVSGLGHLAPIEFAAGALGNAQALRVSRQHHMLISGPRVEQHVGCHNALAAATHLVNGHSIRRAACDRVTYYHLLFDTHQVIWSKGCPTESFHPGATAWSSLLQASRDEILALFPDLEMSGLGAYGPTAHPVLRAHQAAMSFANSAAS